MIRVNLLRPGKKEVVSAADSVSYAEEVAIRKISATAVVAAVALTLGLIGLLYFLQTNKLSFERKQLEDRRLRKAELEKVLKKLEEVEASKKVLEAKIKIIGDLKARQKDTVMMMDKLYTCLPEWVWLTDLNFTNNILNISGKALSNNLISDFINNLENSIFFVKPVTLKTSQRKKEQGSDIMEFKIECRFNNRASEDLK